MELMDPVSKFMSTDLITVRAEDRMMAVREVFDKHRIHHIPVVQNGYLVGMISKQDYLLFLRGKNKNEYEKLIQISQLNNTLVEDVMIKKIAPLESGDHIIKALEIFSENLFHSIPVVDHEKLVGILTTLDIIKAIVVENHLRIKPRKVIGMMKEIGASGNYRVKNREDDYTADNDIIHSLHCLTSFASLPDTPNYTAVRESHQGRKKREKMRKLVKSKSIIY